MQLSATIFKAYDIRGIVPSTIHEDMAEALGRAFGTVARREGETKVAVGRDGRLSGAGLSAALMRGLAAAGTLQALGVTAERDMVNQFMSMPRVYDGACLAWLMLAGAATPVASPLSGHLEFGWS